MDKIKILIVDDSIKIINLISKFLIKENDFLIVGSAIEKENAIKAAISLQPDIILLDLQLTKGNFEGIDIAEILSYKKEYEGKIIIITGFDDTKLVKKCIDTGIVSNYILKDDLAASLSNIIRKTYNNESPMQVIIKEYKKLQFEKDLIGLSDAEKEIYPFLVNGLSNLEIAKSLNKEYQTIKNQVSSILAKLKVKSRKKIINNSNKKL